MIEGRVTPSACAYPSFEDGKTNILPWYVLQKNKKNARGIPIEVGRDQEIIESCQDFV